MWRLAWRQSYKHSDIDTHTWRFTQIPPHQHRGADHRDIAWSVQIAPDVRMARCVAQKHRFLCANEDPPLRATFFFEPTNWGVCPKMVGKPPTTIGFFLLNMDHFGVFWGYHHLRKHPHMCHIYSWGDDYLPNRVKSIFSHGTCCWSFRVAFWERITSSEERMKNGMARNTIPTFSGDTKKNIPGTPSVLFF